MILIECPICNRRELASTRRIERLENTDRGIVASVRCSQGHLHQMLTGANRPAEPATDIAKAGAIAGTAA